MYRAPQHPSWCRCRLCDAADLEQERRVLAAYPELPEPEIVEPPASLPACDPDPYELRREDWDRRTVEQEVHDGAFA
jgi:hypothetical protein